MVLPVRVAYHSKGHAMFNPVADMFKCLTGATEALISGQQWQLRDGVDELGSSFFAKVLTF
jgi:hypothetical protein